MAKKCSHFWVCEPPNGEFSDAKCKKCGDETQFRNSFERKKWGWNGAMHRNNGGKGHGLTKEQLEKKLSDDGVKLDPIPDGLFASNKTKKERLDEALEQKGK